MAGVTISAGKGTGVLHSANNGAAALAGTTAVTGQIIIKWTSNVKLTSKESTLTVTAITGGVSGSYAYVSIGSGQATVSGDFEGTDSGRRLRSTPSRPRRWLRWAPTSFLRRRASRP